MLVFALQSRFNALPDSCIGYSSDPSFSLSIIYMLSLHIFLHYHGLP